MTGTVTPGQQTVTGRALYSTAWAVNMPLSGITIPNHRRHHFTGFLLNFARFLGSLNPAREALVLRTKISLALILPRVEALFESSSAAGGGKRTRNQPLLESFFLFRSYLISPFSRTFTHRGKLTVVRLNMLNMHMVRTGGSCPVI